MTSRSGAARATYTWNDFVALEEDDLRELIDGELVEVEVPTFDHEEVVGWTYFIAASLVGDETFRPESFEGLEIDLAALWK